MFKNYILENKKNIIENLCNLITFPSISEENDNKKAPFGRACSDCLKYFLHLAESMGFTTKNVDNYAGYVEFGQGDQLIGIVGHLDVVPADEDYWTYSPFTPTISNGKIYGRGAIDDKGPMIASLFAMKAVKDYIEKNNIILNKKVRLIIGLNEEKDWHSIEYYKKHEEIPNLSFSPDADFPCIYAEKSVVSLKIFNDISNNSSSNIVIEQINTQDNSINVVPKFCSVILKLKNKNLMMNLINSCKKYINKYKYDIDVFKIDDFHLKLTSYGKSSHSAHPELGINAISKLIIVLNNIFNDFHLSFHLFDNFCKYIGDTYNGENLGLNLEDESGKLTLNASQFYIENNKICIGIDLRIPVHTNPEIIVNTFKNRFNNTEIIKIKPSLYIQKDNPLVKKLCSIFNKECGTNFEPISIGGATYARAFPNCISFGMNFPGDKDMCHQADEFVDIDKLLLSSNIYAKAIYELIQ